MWIKYRHQFLKPEDYFAWKDIGDTHIDIILDELAEDAQARFETDKEVDILYYVFDLPPREILIEHIRGARDTVKRWRNRLEELQELLEKIPE
jgi:hypothetical protein